MADQAAILRAAPAETRPVLERALRDVGEGEDPPGSNAGPFVDALTEGNAEPWCADWAGRVFQDCGIAAPNGDRPPRISGAKRLVKWWQAHGRGVDLRAERFRPADLIAFDRGGGKGHVEIVLADRGGELLTVGANVANAVRISRRKRRLVVLAARPVVPADRPVVTPR